MTRGTKRPSPSATGTMINEANAFTKYITESSDVVIMDGGTGSEIGNRAPESLSEDSWTGAAQLTIPQVIEDIHTEYLMCGAQIVTTNTYASNKHCLDGDGVGERHIEANQIGVTIAKSALARRKQMGANEVPLFVMGSISTHPPIFKAAVKAANNLESEVGVDVVNATGLSLWPSTDEELGNFMSQAQALKEGGVDAIALEMVKDLYHGKLVLKAAFATGLPVALGVTIKIHADGLAYIRDEDILLVDALKQYLEVCPNIVCINIMHSPAEFISTGLEAVRTVWDGTMGCYPNNGTPESWPEWTEGDLQPEDLVKFAAGWAAQGATLIGGCCGIGPAHIRALSQHFQKPTIFAPSL